MPEPYGASISTRLAGSLAVPGLVASRRITVTVLATPQVFGVALDQVCHGGIFFKEGRP